MNVDAAMQSLSRFIIRYRWVWLALIALITAALVNATKYLVVNNDYDNWLPANDRVSELYRLVDRQFASTAVLFTVLDFSEKGVFQPDSLALVQRMTDALEGIDELFNVSSLTNIVDIRKTDFGVEVGDLIPEIPGSREELDALKQYVLSKEMYVNALISEDAAYTVLIANIDGSSEEIVTAKKVLETIDEVADGHPYYFGGDPALLLYADHYMKKDLTFLVPFVLVVMVVILAASFRTGWGVVLPLILVFLCVVWTFGLQALFGIYSNMLTTAVVVLLIAMGADYSVHIYNHYLRRGDVQVSTAEITLPVIMSAVTTIAGLLTFGLTRIDLLRFFGIELAFGLGSACLLSVVLIPICLYLFKAKANPIVGGEERQEDAINRWLAKAGVWVHRHARLTLAAVLIGMIAVGSGLFRITTNADFIEFMPEDSPPRVGGNILRDHFSGFYPISIYFQGDMGDPALMQMENYIENYLRSYELTSAFTSINGLIAEENWLMNGVFAVPETREGIANLWLLLEGEELLKTFVAEDRQQSLVTAMIREPQTYAMRFISKSVGGYLEAETSDQVVRIDPAGLSPDGLRALRALQLSEAALQLAWLAESYDKPRKYDSNLFLEGLEKGFPEIDRSLDLGAVWEASRTYLDAEALEILPPELIDRLMALLKENVQKPSAPELHDQIAGVIAASKVMDAEDAASTAKGVLNRAGSVFRIQRASSLRAWMAPLLSDRLKDHKDFRKRADGVLWTLWAEKPVFFSSQIAPFPDIGSAAIATAPIRVEPTGFPDLVRRFDDLLFASQIQSLGLASLVVLVLVSLTQRSFRRGIISLLSVLVPLGYILGFMGWSQIPLDFGTVLFGALIVGLGVDGSIHFMHHNHDLQLRGIHGEEAIRRSMGHVGKAILTANATTCCGFLVLLFSSSSVLRNFGIVNSTAIFLVTISLITFLPALVTVLQVANGRDERSGN
jgi:predicted RND superfamily exporter protein